MKFQHRLAIYASAILLTAGCAAPVQPIATPASAAVLSLPAASTVANSSFDMTITIKFLGGANRSAACQGKGWLAPGNDVLVHVDNKIVGATEMIAGIGGDEQGLPWCVAKLVVDDVPEAKLYTISIGGEGDKTVKLSEARAGVVLTATG